MRSAGRILLRPTAATAALLLGLSSVAMVVATLGHLVPAVGALLQEAIDVTVILNALRAART